MPLILPGNVATELAGASYSIDKSCRFDGSNDYLTITFSGSPTSNQKGTVSYWTKRSGLGASMFSGLVAVETGVSSYGTNFNAADNLDFWFYYPGSGDDYEGELKTNAKFRDVSAWFHVVFSWDTTQSTNTNRLKLYINGVNQKDAGGYATETYPNQNQAVHWGQTGTAHRIGANPETANNKWNGYMAEVVYIDGIQYAASDFGEFDSDSPTIWKPKDVSGLNFTGNNSFHLDFEDSSDLGNDVSGNNNDFAATGTAAVDQSSDSPTNNFCTLNNIATTGSIGDDLTFGEGNCRITNTSSGAWHPAIGTIAAKAGKWYAEFKVNTLGSASKYAILDPEQYTESVNFAAADRGYSYEYNAGAAVNDGNFTDNWGDTFTTNDIISVAMDLDNMHLYFAKNGTWQDSGDPTSGATGTGTHPYFGGGSNTARAAGTDYYAFATNIHNNSVTDANFGGCPAFAISSAAADANGYGTFEYAPPSGFYALCTKNLAEFGG